MSSSEPNNAATLMERLTGDRPGDGTDWIAALRRDAGSLLAERGLPTTRMEDWKYTSIKPIEKRDFRRPTAAEATADADAVEAERIPNLHSQRLVFVNGHYSAALSDHDDGQDGLHVHSLAAVLADNPERLRERFTACAPSDFSGFTAMNTAFVEDGVLVEASADTRFERPLELLFLSTSTDEPLAINPRVIVAAEHHANLTVIEHFVGLGDAANLTNSVTEISLAEGARLNHYRLQREGRKGFHVGSVHVVQAAGSRYESHNLQIGGQLSRTDINTALDGEGAETLFNGLYMLNGRQHSDTHTRINHNQPRTTSEEAYRGILDQYARGVFNGRVYVAPDAQQIAAYQSNDNLLLSGKAEIDTKPELEIYADDVVCSHGATIGQLDRQALFYLRSRGVEEETARGLLLYAFAEAAIGRMGLQAVRDWLHGFVIEELPQSERVREFV